MWWTNGLRSDGGRVVAATVCKYRNGWTAFSCHLGNGRVEVYDAELWVFVLALRESAKEEGHTADTQSDEGCCIQRLGSGHPMNGAPGTWARAASSQVDQPKREDPSQGRN